MFFLYNLFLTLLFLPLQIFSFFNTEFRIFINYRRQEKKELSNFTINEKCIWLHAASVGELDQCKALAKIIKLNEKNTFILQTIFSNSVKENNYDWTNTDLYLHLPLDFFGNYDWIFKKFKPSSLVLMAWDTWPNLIYASKRFHCKLFLSSAVWDKDSKRNRFAFTKELFSKFDGISPVSQKMETDFQKLTEGRVSVIACGDSRFDFIHEKILSTKPNADFNSKIIKLEYSKVLILASTYSNCEAIIFPVLKEILELGYHVWIFPHKVSSERIKGIENELKSQNLQFEKFSSLESRSKIILFDTLGVLAYAYKYAKIAYVGGAIHNKIHNVLEPIYFKLGLISGKRIFNSYDATELSRLGNLLTIKNSEEFLLAFRKLQNKSENNFDYFTKGIGNSEKFYKTFLASKNAI